MMTISSIKEETPQLASVKLLWRAHSDTLGFFPDGAFNEYAAKGQILGAIEENECLGYLLYRTTADRAVIVHLCVAPSAQGKGIARRLVAELVTRTRHLRGIGLRCRRDFAVSALWPKLGFMAAHDQPGRAGKPTQLTFWWMDHGHPTLFTTATAQSIETTLPAVVDANVFYDLIDLSRPDSPESRSLQAGWLENAIELFVTTELYNEINRNPDKTSRDRNRRYADSFPKKSAATDALQSTLLALRRVFPQNAPNRLDADLRQIAHAIASDTSFFITRDEYLLRHEDVIYREFGLVVIRPAELIVRLDELQRENAYRPMALAGTGLKMHRMKSVQDDVLSATFVQTYRKETREQFKRQIHIFLSQPERYECLVAYDADDAPVVFMVLDYGKTDELNVPILRLNQRPLGLTVLRHLLRRLTSSSVRKGRYSICVSENCLNSSVEVALQELHFQERDSSYRKLCIDFVGSLSGLREKLRAMGGRNKWVEQLSDQLSEEFPEDSTPDWRRVESMLCPAKIVDSFTPCFIIPIRAKWAQHLFDPKLAEQTLFGAAPDLALSLETVYYRSKYPTGNLRGPGRILWYVSKDSRFVGSGSLRACSAIDRITVDKPKVLYNRYRRLGVYQWRNVYEVAKCDIDKDIMAIQFSDSELLDRPIPWRDLQTELLAYGIHTSLQSPIEIPTELFLRLQRYDRGQA